MRTLATLTAIALLVLALACSRVEQCYRGGKPTWNSTSRCQCIDEDNNFYGELLKSEVCADEPLPHAIPEATPEDAIR